MNALFGIEASNEYRRDTIMTDYGIAYDGVFGIENKPKNPKAWYQFGQRIVGWSRIAQLCAMQLCSPYIETIVNGDTDSLKFLVRKDNLGQVNEALEVFAKSVDKAKDNVCKRVKKAYPDYYDELKGIGHYVLEFQAQQFCASWNKAYCMRSLDKRDGKYHYAFTLAGIPTKRRENDNQCFIGVNGLADRFDGLGYSFDEVCNIFLGYNVTYAYDVIRLNSRSFPEWGDICNLDVMDYTGHTSKVCEPCALALYPMSKTVNDTRNKDNHTNMLYAIENNPEVSTEGLFIHSKGITSVNEVL